MNNNKNISKTMIVSSTMFIMTSIYWIKQQHRQRKRRSLLSLSSSSATTTTNDDDNDHLISNIDDQKRSNKGNMNNKRKQNNIDIPNEVLNGMISQRGSDIASGKILTDHHYNNNDNTGSKTTVVVASMNYITYFLYAIQYMYHMIDETTGYIPLCIAENKLCTDIMIERMNQYGTIENAFHEHYVYHYFNSNGLPMARDSISYFLCRYFYYMPTCNNTPSPSVTPTITPDTTLQQQKQPSTSSPFPVIHIEDALQLINPNHIIIGPGACAILNHLFYVLSNDNNNANIKDCCLIPAPYYAAFENDMILYANVIPFPIHVDIVNIYNGPTIQELNDAYNNAISLGYRVRFIMICNPNNPLGIIYPVTTIQNIMKWCRSKSINNPVNTIHMIFDEIYALSTHALPGQHQYQSIIKITNNVFNNDIHMLYSLSKDFGISGIRYGILYTQNEYVLKAISVMNILHCVSGPIQYILSELLTDDIFIEHYITTSRERILMNYNICIYKLQEMVIPYIIPNAGIFIYIDLSSLLPSRTIEYERQLTDMVRFIYITV